MSELTLKITKIKDEDKNQEIIPTPHVQPQQAKKKKLKTNILGE